MSDKKTSPSNRRAASAGNRRAAAPKSAAPKNRRALGRGLDALFQPSPAASDPAYKSQSVFSCSIERINPRRDQPRQQFDSDALDELARTIAEHGIIQPIVVRRLGNDQFEIIAGERRWRAAQRAEKKEVPVVVKDISSDDAFELALIENLQRADLNPIEVAEAYQRLLADHGHTQAQLGERMGKSRVAITNSLRLLKLPESVRLLIRRGDLSEGHGRVLLAAPDATTMMQLATKAVRGRLSVRKLEGLLKGKGKGKGSDKTPTPSPKSANVRDLERRITQRIGARVNIEQKGKGGRVVVHYNDLDELDRLLARLGA